MKVYDNEDNELACVRRRRSEGDCISGGSQDVNHEVDSRDEMTYTEKSDL